MTNGELFIAENPNIETKINGSCVWIYYPDGVNHYTMPVSWWEQEISLFDKIRAEIEQTEINGYIRDVECFSAGINVALNVINKYRNEVSS